MAYALDSPLEACGTAAAYAAYPKAVAVLVSNPLFIFHPPTFSNYSATLPIYVAYDTVGTYPFKTGTPAFHFNASTGSIELQPTRDVSSASAQGDNKYAAVAKITEYCRVGGRLVEVGSVHCELYFVVYECGPNLLLQLAPTVAVQTGTGMGTQNTVQPLSQIIPVVTGEPVSLLLTATDGNSAQLLTFNLDHNATPGTTLQNLGAGQARLTFTPPLSLPPGLYRVAVTAETMPAPSRASTRGLSRFA